MILTQGTGTGETNFININKYMHSILYQLLYVYASRVQFSHGNVTQAKHASKTTTTTTTTTTGKSLKTMVVGKRR